ncbi:hypothetical protein [Aeromicrobium sp.]|uniref:hypothetical protein n=1 Tax=Aeromicrobium sp. TaxID=1871063 RepID=UPI002FCC88DB
MSRRRIVVGGWLLLSVVVLFLPGPEVTVGRSYDPPDSESVSIVPLTTILGLTSLAIGLVVVAIAAIRKRLA